MIWHSSFNSRIAQLADGLRSLSTIAAAYNLWLFLKEKFPTLANVDERFIPGEVYNIGGEEFRSVQELSDLILNYLGLDDSLVEYLPEDKHNVLNKRPDITKAKLGFGHNPKTTLEEGVPKTIEWMKTIYNVNGPVRLNHVKK